MSSAAPEQIVPDPGPVGTYEELQNMPATPEIGVVSEYECMKFIQKNGVEKSVVCASFPQVVALNAIVKNQDTRDLKAMDDDFSAANPTFFGFPSEDLVLTGDDDDEKAQEIAAYFSPFGKLCTGLPKGKGPSEVTVDRVCRFFFMFNKSNQIVLMMPTSGDDIGMATFSTDDLSLDSKSMDYAQDAKLSADIENLRKHTATIGAVFKSGDVYSFDFPVMTAQTDASKKTSTGGDIGEDMFSTENKLVSVPVGGGAQAPPVIQAPDAPGAKTLYLHHMNERQFDEALVEKKLNPINVADLTMLDKNQSYKYFQFNVFEEPSDIIKGDKDLQRQIAFIKANKIKMNVEVLGGDAGATAFAEIFKKAIDPSLSSA